MMGWNRIWGVLSFGVFLGFLGVWEVVARMHLVSPVFLPPASAALSELVNGFQNGTLVGPFVASLERMLYGWLLASVIAVSIGCMIGISPTLRAYLEPVLEFLRPLPASSIIPVAIAFLGLSQTMVIAVIAFGSLWPALLGAVQGVVSVEPRLYEVARSLRLSRLQIIWKIALPNALPDIFAGMRIGLAIALILTVVGEFLAGQEGLGLAILQAARRFRADQLFAGVLLLGIIGYFSTVAMAAVEQRLLRWRHAA